MQMHAAQAHGLTAVLCSTSVCSTDAWRMHACSAGVCNDEALLFACASVLMLQLRCLTWSGKNAVCLVYQKCTPLRMAARYDVSSTLQLCGMYMSHRVSMAAHSCAYCIACTCGTSLVAPTSVMSVSSTAVPRRRIPLDSRCNQSVG